VPAVPVAWAAVSVPLGLASVKSCNTQSVLPGALPWSNGSVAVPGP
jgi:hypothetical protein